MKYHVEFDIDLKRNPYKGLYVALEGVDGSGKTTQAKRLAKHFEKLGREVVLTREPRKDHGIVADFVRKLLLGKIKIPAVAFQYLFSADREMHHEELIVPSLKAGRVVISDRCFWSSIPYGVLDRHAELDENSREYLLVSQSILSMYHQFIVPDKTFYLSISLNQAMKRLDAQEGPSELYEERGKLKKVILGYERIVREFEKEFVRIDGERPIENVTGQMIDKLG